MHNVTQQLGFNQSTTNGSNNNKQQQHMHSILRKNTKQETATNYGKKVAKVDFLKYDKAVEEERQQRGVQLRRRLRLEKEIYKQYKKEMAQNNSPDRVYAALLNPDNAIPLNGYAQFNRSFRTTLFALYGDIAALPNVAINPQPPDALGLLNAMVFANVPFLTIIVNPDIRDGLDMIGALQGFRPFMVPPPVSAGKTKT